jgi:hypothetical protein
MTAEEGRAQIFNKSYVIPVKLFKYDLSHIMQIILYKLYNRSNIIEVF